MGEGGSLRGLQSPVLTCLAPEGGPFPFGEGSQGREDNQRKVMGFSPSSAQGKGGAGFQMFDSCWPKGAAELPRPSATRSLPEAPTVPGASGPAERASPAQPAPSLRTRPERRAPAQAHFRKKSLSSRRPQPDPHPAVSRDSGRFGTHLYPAGHAFYC